RRSRSAHWASSVVLPNPAGATIVTIVPSPVLQRRLSRAVRTTAFPVAGGTRGLDAGSARLNGSRTDTLLACRTGCGRPRGQARRGGAGTPTRGVSRAPVRVEGGTPRYRGVPAPAYEAAIVLVLRSSNSASLIAPSVRSSFSRASSAAVEVVSLGAYPVSAP